MTIFQLGCGRAFLFSPTWSLSSRYPASDGKSCEAGAPFGYRGPSTCVRLLPHSAQDDKCGNGSLARDSKLEAHSSQLAAPVIVRPGTDGSLEWRRATFLAASN